MSTRKKTGEKYPPKTVHMLLCGIQRYMREQKEVAFNIFSMDDPAFKQLMTTCDSLYRELREEGVGAGSAPTQTLADAEIEKLWTSGVLSVDSPQGLLNAVFFYNRRNFLLRGGAEHRKLKLSQVKKNTSPEGRERYTYSEHVSKNRRGGVGQLDLSHKVVHQFRDDSLGERCHVFILDKYYSKLPACVRRSKTSYICVLWQRFLKIPLHHGSRQFRLAKTR